MPLLTCLLCYLSLAQVLRTIVGSKTMIVFKECISKRLCTYSAHMDTTQCFVDMHDKTGVHIYRSALTRPHKLALYQAHGGCITEAGRSKVGY